VSGITSSDRRTARHQATRLEIVEAAWAIVREEGLAGLSMRDLGRRLGMRAQSIYSYFASKNEIYDAMFLEGYRAFLDWMTLDALGDHAASDPRAAARASAHAFVEFCTTDPVRYQLLFQRTIPDFSPSDESWAVALAAYDQLRVRLLPAGLDDQVTLDLWTAVMTGLTDQQISNDPGGTRWTQLVDRAVDMLFDEANAHTSKETDQP
jgi:AcrR family transcriptional regulator